MTWAGQAPIELAGADLQGLPWMQVVNLVLSVWPLLPYAPPCSGPAHNSMTMSKSWSWILLDFLEIM
jgi:hypothetical protein